MIINGSGFEYPLNLYSDISAFREEDRERCYYYHQDAAGAALPCDPLETVEHILSEHFGGDILPQLIHSVYKCGLSIEEAAQSCGISADRAEQRIIKAFRDFNYFPLFRDTLRSGADAERNEAFALRREEHIKNLSSGFKNRCGKSLRSVLVHDFVSTGELSGKTDELLKKYEIRDLNSLASLTETELSLIFRGNESEKAEIKQLLAQNNLALFAG